MSVGCVELHASPAVRRDPRARLERGQEEARRDVARRLDLGARAAVVEVEDGELGVGRHTVVVGQCGERGGAGGGAGSVDGLAGDGACCVGAVPIAEVVGLVAHGEVTHQLAVRVVHTI